MPKCRYRERRGQEGRDRDREGETQMRMRQKEAEKAVRDSHRPQRQERSSLFLIPDGACTSAKQGKF